MQRRQHHNGRCRWRSYDAGQARSWLRFGEAGLERYRHSQPVHHSNDHFSGRLQYFSADLFARLFLHGFPRIDLGACQFHRAGQLSRAAGRSLHLDQFHDHREVRAGVGRRAGSGGLRRGLAAQSQFAGQGAGHHVASAAHDDVHGGRRLVLATAVQPVVGHHQLCVGPGGFRVAVERRSGALCGRADRHLDVVAVRDVAVARWFVRDSTTPLLSRRDRPRHALVYLHPYHAAAGDAAAADCDHFPHYGGVQDLRSGFHHDQHGYHRVDRHPALQDGLPGMADWQVLRARLHRPDHGARNHQHLREVPQPGEGALMAAVASKGHRIRHRLLVALVFLLVVVYLLPLYWISSTAFKPRSLATTVPPTVVFEPEVTPFVKLFTSRVQMRGEVEPEIYAKAPWYEKRVFDAGERIIKDANGKLESSGYLSRFLNSIIIAVTSTFLAVAMGTL